MVFLMFSSSVVCYRLAAGFAFPRLTDFLIGINVRWFFVLFRLAVVVAALSVDFSFATSYACFEAHFLGR